MDLMLDLNGEWDTTLIVVTHSDALASRFPRKLSLESGHRWSRPDAHDSLCCRLGSSCFAQEASEEAVETVAPGKENLSGRIADVQTRACGA